MQIKLVGKVNRRLGMIFSHHDAMQLWNVFKYSQKFHRLNKFFLKNKQQICFDFEEEKRKKYGEENSPRYNCPWLYKQRKYEWLSDVWEAIGGVFYVFKWNWYICKSERESEIYSKILWCCCHMHEHVIDGMKLKWEIYLYKKKLFNLLIISSWK